MTRDELRGIVEGITDEQLKQILDINSADIGKAKGSFKEMQQQLEEANRKLAEGENLQAQLDEAKQRLTEYEGREADRALSERFSAVSREDNFINELTRQGIENEFRAALQDKDNKDKADADIYQSIVDGRDNILIPDGGIPKIVAVGPTVGGGSFATDENEVREIMGLPSL